MKALRNYGEKARRIAWLMRATLREIFDESAYERFLRRHQAAASRQSYRSFLREAALRRERRPRCC